MSGKSVTTTQTIDTFRTWARARGMNNIESWKMKCIDTGGNNNIYTKDKIYEVIDLRFMCDDNEIFDLRRSAIPNFEQFQNYSTAKWEIIDEIKNWKMKCICNAPRNGDIYTENKIYEVVNLRFMCDDGYIVDLQRRGTCTFESFNNWSDSTWELVKDKYYEIEKYLNKKIIL